MLRKLKLLSLFIGIGCLLPRLAISSDNKNVRIERMMPRMGPGGGGPMNPPSPPPPKGPRKSPPPVNEDFATSCSLQKAEFSNITCEDDGQFAEIQCMRKKCFCVDPTTGDRLNSRTFSEREKVSTNCSAEVNCPNFVGCTKVCDGGYRLDREECPTCKCAPPPTPVRCNSVTTLIEDLGCHCACVVEGDVTPRGGPRTRMMANCPSCDEDCNANPPVNSDDCLVTDPDQCPEDTTLQTIGRNGNPTCVQDLDDASDCTPAAVEGEELPNPKPKGADKRKKAGVIESATTPCRRGFVCRQMGFMVYQCEPENSESPCVMARVSDPNIQCEPNGNFRPLQCHVPVVEQPGNASNTTSTSSDSTRTKTKTKTEGTGGVQSCRCVHPENGTTVEGSELVLGERDKKPNCNRVYKDCTVPGIHQHRGPRRRTYRVRHGDSYFDTANCRTCQCTDGDITSFCTLMGECSVLLPDNTTNNCTLDNGEVLLHSETTEVGCDVCGCRDGRLKCTHQRDCEDNSNKTDPCDMCRDEPTSPVCGPDGRNHLSMCTAIYCAGIPAVELKDGPCQSQDVCEEYPCEANFLCIRSGAVACLGTGGCTPDQLRSCVNISALNCPIELETEDSGNGTTNVVGDDAICGTDNQTYVSLCQLVQTTTNVHVAHTGPCEDPECQGGQVCGSDGVTYPNPCALESLSSTRVDYPGACVSGDSAEAICVTVLTEGRCVINSANCRRLVFPQDGCCPICGGAVSVAVDRAALSDAARTNPEVQTVDMIAVRMIEDEVFEGIEGKCAVEASPTDTSDLQLALTAMEEEYSDLCFRKSEEIAERVNTGALPSDSSQPLRATAVTLPQVYDFAVAAVAAQQVVTATPSTTERNGDSGLYPGVVIVSLTAATLYVVLY